MSVTPQAAAKRLADAGFNFGDRYRAGATGKGSKWQQGATGAEANYEAGVAKSLSEKRYGKGVSGAGASAYDEGVRVKGVNNWGPGMQAASSKYQRKVQPFTSLWDQSLPTPRGARGSAANFTRMTENAKRFSDAKK